METVNVGKIVNTHGIRGELKVQSLTDFEEDRFKKGNKLFIKSNRELIEVTVKSYRYHKNHILLLLEGLEDINLVEKYKGCFLVADKDEDLLDDDEYYVEDLIGLDVYDYGRHIGKVKDVLVNDFQTIFVVEGKQKVMIPYVDAFVKDIDLDENRIQCELIEGFYNED